jgi:HAD superfamily hydrolase (TIGR01509 family)
MTLRGLVFDFDGLILDTETPIFETWREVYRRHGRELGLEVWQVALGTHGAFDPCAHLAAVSGLSLDCEALRDEARRRNLARCAAQPLLPGVRERLEEARGLRLPVAVASSSTRGWVEGWLARHAVAPLVQVVCGREDVARVKPAPDLFLLAARRLSLPPASCLVFEDSPNGVRAARAAGMRCVAVPNAVTRTLASPEPDLRLSSLAEATLGEIEQRLGFEARGSSAGAA